ncbi:MAG: hypothetical protein H6659_06010 [Ardenticatenaceae bacterium]|nr:hypothetical protein [Ardenticatenaceae bacterium]
MQRKAWGCLASGFFFGLILSPARGATSGGMARTAVSRPTTAVSPFPSCLAHNRHSHDSPL